MRHRPGARALPVPGFAPAARHTPLRKVQGDVAELDKAEAFRCLEDSKTVMVLAPK
ncbi:hypothetical protein [Novosphingobium sp.]|uniref:hypothetical protein n=1 Tax=Novosphingobium sp. TaxID=1874826 RepID=UPI002637CF8F|nr:hypothetical protein [Novosphingobium sp.]